MKKLLFLLITVHTLNAYSQLNLKWSSTQSISAGTYKTSSSYFNQMDIGAFSSASNEHFESTGDSVKGVIRKYDATTGALQWSTVLSTAVSLASFPGGGIASLSYTEAGVVIVAYNTDPSTSHLIRINSNGTIAWDIVVNGINNIWHQGSAGAYSFVVGRTPQSNCGGFPCNGIAIAKYDTTGQEIWTQTRYTSGLRTRPSAGFVDNDGTLSVCGKKAPASSANYNQPFVLKYAPDGTLLWEKLFNANITEAAKQDIEVDANNNIYFAGADGNAVKLRKLSGANGALQWTKSINNSEFVGITVRDLPTVSIILATSTGMKAYNTAGNLLWSNGFLSSLERTLNFGNPWSITFFATKVSTIEPLSNFLVQLDAVTGTVLYQKDLTFGNHEEYSHNRIDVVVDGPSSYMLINDTTQPYGTRLTKLSPCSEFTYSFNATATATDVSNAGCNNGVITVNLSGTFNSWPYLELYNSANILVKKTSEYLTPMDTALTPGNYTVKVFDESCGEQVFNVTVRCPVPTGLNTTNITRNKARLNWVLPTCNAGVQLQYRLQGAAAWTTVNTTASYKQLNGLTPNSVYEWQLASKCAGSNPAVYSDYSAIQIFTTSSQLLGDPEITIDNTEEIKQEISSNPDKESAKPGFNIYPNPASNQITIQNNNHKMLGTVSIYDVSGKMIYKKFVGSSQATIDLENFSQGVYFVRSDQLQVTIKFVKQ